MDDLTMLSEARRRLPAARTALAIAIGDMPCSGTSQGGSGTSDRTGRIALGVIDGVDTAWTDSRELDRLERIIIAKCNAGLSWTYLLPKIMVIVDRWAPSDTQQAKLEANLRSAADDLLNKTEDHGNCISCKRVPGVFNDPHKRGLCWGCNHLLERILANFDVDLDMPPKRLIEIRKERGRAVGADINAVMHGTRRRTP